MLKNSNVLIIIPARNEGESIMATINDLKSYCPDYDYIVINDGSTDDTEEVCLNMGVDVITLPYNLGLEGAFQTGVKFAKKKGYDIVCQFDADGQHKAKYISKMVDKINEGFDIVIGSRYINKRKPKNLRMLGSRIISRLLYMTTGRRVCDPTSGMRMLGKEVIEVFAKTMNHAPEPDTIAYLMYSKKSKIIEIPVTMEERIFGESYLTINHSIKYMFRICVSLVLIQWFRKGVIL